MQGSESVTCVHKVNRFSGLFLIAGLPAEQMLDPPTSGLFFSTPPSPSCASQALLST